MNFVHIHTHINMCVCIRAQTMSICFDLLIKALFFSLFTDFCLHECFSQ